MRTEVRNTERTEFISNSAADTEAIGAAFAKELSEKYPDTLYFIKLKGPLGAGKTAFTRGVASVLSPGSRVKSPSYTIVNEYRMGDTPLFHFDLYRLGDGADLSDIGFHEYTESGHCIIEWSEYLPQNVPGAVTVEIEPDADGTRNITITYPEKVTQ